MPQRTYLLPTGLLEAPLGYPRAPNPGDPLPWMPLAGSTTAFSALEIITRDGASITRRMKTVASIAGPTSERLTGRALELVGALVGPRPPLSGRSLGGRPLIMGILNVTPDSFSDGGRHRGVEAQIAHALKMAEDGADIIDIGGESTRPGSDPVHVEEEIRRVVPIFEGLRERTDALLSIDTRNAAVMEAALAKGAGLINEVSALTHDPRALGVAAASGLPVVLMHAPPDPKTMMDNPVYEDVLTDVYDYLDARIRACEAAGIDRGRLIVDPGIGFGKTRQHNLEVLSGLAVYHGLGVPLLVGSSRKRFIGDISGVSEAGERVMGSLGAALAAAAQGAQILRVHDVAATRQALDVWYACRTGTWDAGAP